MKTIVICCDGTGNEAKEAESNVLRLARMAVKDESQLVYYDPGVGTQGAPKLGSSTWQEIQKLLGLAMASGIYDKLGSAYRYLMDHYREGDQILLFGFSRGAFTARALAGLVAKLGILEPSRGNLIPYAIKLYMEPRNIGLAAKFSAAFCDRTKVPIHFMGLWDTVKSVFQFDPLSGSVKRVSLPRTFENDAVATVRHAVSIDERRCFYRTNLWTADVPPGQDVRQLWFAGVHSDVGGGYPELEGGLSKVSLRWLLDEAELAGLRLDTKRVREIVPPKATTRSSAPDPLGPLHDSLRGVWWVPEVLLLKFGRRRTIADGALVHASVEQRIKNDPAYRPGNLPPAGRYQVVER